MEVSKIIENLLIEKDAEKIEYITHEAIEEHKWQCDYLIDLLEKYKWIPCGERLPEPEKEVIVITDRRTITTALYEDGTIYEEDSLWNWTDIDFKYDENEDKYIIPEGWCEYRHFNPDDVYNNVVDERIIAWMPLPDLYREEE